MFYDDTLNDDQAHDHVVSARKAGKAWAEREFDALVGEPPGEWCSTYIDARPLVSFPPYSNVEDQYDRELELAEIANDAAAARWAELVEDYEGSEEHAEYLAVRAATGDGFEHPRERGCSAAPLEWERYQDVDAPELRAQLEDPELLGSPPADTGPDGAWLRSWEDERANVGEALEALARGEQVRGAQDDDGWWFSYQRR